MRRHERLLWPWSLGLWFLLSSPCVYAGEDPVTEAVGTLVGTVTLDTTGDPIHGAEVLIVTLGRSTYADSEGRFEFENVPTGVHEILAVREHLIANTQIIEVSSGEVTEVNIALTLTPIHEEITVTASAREITTFDAFNSVTSLDSMDLAEKMGISIGEVLEDEPGIYKRSFGPGSVRPIIRGFDGDRVLIMQDGIRTGDLSSQSGDHGVTIDPGGLERLEVVKGPSTLLYGSNAVGGVVNAVTPHDTFYHDRHVGTNGQVVTDFGSANAQVGINGSFQHTQESWALWGGGGAHRSGDYDTPEGKVENSATRLSNVKVGLGYLNPKAFFSAGYQVEDGRYGVPGIGELHGHGRDEGEGELAIDLDTFRQSARFDAGIRNLENNFVDTFRFIFNYLDWQHDELEVVGSEENIGTSFDNKTSVLRAEVQQKKVGNLTGRFGFWGMLRDYKSVGEEALTPPTTQNAWAGFVYEELELNASARLQFGARVEHNGYDPEERAELEHEGEEEEHDELAPPDARRRDFTGFSGSVGLHQALGENRALVANFTAASRAPALEELYNFGPHVGNLAFEIGNPDLSKETSWGVDLSMRSQANRMQGQINFYYYDINNFVYPAFTGDVADGLRVAKFLQGDSRFVGVDGEGRFELHKYASLELDIGYTDAKLTEVGEFLPRIPPLHGRVALEIPYKSLTVRPELVWASEQDKISLNETPTGGYSIFNVNASYLLPAHDVAHVFSIRAYNLTNELYRLHTSFIKEFAPEMGRGIMFSYALRFF